MSMSFATIEIIELQMFYLWIVFFAVLEIGTSGGNSRVFLQFIILL